jgi:hypothetical protein
VLQAEQHFRQKINRVNWATFKIARNLVH